MDVEIISWARAIERVLIIAIAGMSLFLGSNLFLKGVVQEHVADLSIYNCKIRLQKLGPGVFFALFGSVIICLAIASPFQITSKAGKVAFPASDGTRDKVEAAPNQQNAKQGPSDIVQQYAMPTDKLEQRRVVRAMNTLLEQPVSNHATPALASDQSKARSIFTAYRDSFITSVLGDQTAVPVWNRTGGDVRRAASQSEMDTIGRMAPWMEGVAAEQ